MRLIVMVNAFAHKATKTVKMVVKSIGVEELKNDGTDLWEEAEVSEQIEHPELGVCYLGMFICGPGMFDVHFPKDHTRPPSNDEWDKLCKNRYGMSSGGSFTIDSGGSVKATEELLSKLPVRRTRIKQHES